MNGMGNFIPPLTGRPDSITKRIGDRLERISSRLVAREIGNLGTGTDISDARFKNDSSIVGPSALRQC
jgi:hypothetical protein